VKIILEEVETLPQLVKVLYEGVRYDFNEADRCEFTAYGVDYEEFQVVGRVGFRPRALVGDEVRGGENDQSPFVLAVTTLVLNGEEKPQVKAVRLIPVHQRLELLGANGEYLKIGARIRVIIPT
jgi:hypothetical protein